MGIIVNTVNGLPDHGLGQIHKIGGIPKINDVILHVDTGYVCPFAVDSRGLL